MALRRASRLLVALVVASTFAGCMGDRDGTQGSVDPGLVPDPQGTTGTPAPATVSGFLVENLQVVPEGATNRTLMEDDVAVVRFTVRQPADASGAGTHFVTYLVGGRIVSTENVRLSPGEGREYEKTITDLRGLTKVEVEVRVGGSKANLTAPVGLWPRAPGETAFGSLTMTISNWTADLQANATLVNLTFSRAPASPQQMSNFRIKTLCADAAGAVTGSSSQRPELPGPGETLVHELRLPGCGAQTLYGVEYRADGFDGTPITSRVLFVPAVWKPGAPTA